MKKILTVLTTLLLLSVIGTTNVLAEEPKVYVNGPGTGNVDVGKATIAEALAADNTGESSSSPTTIKLNADIQENITIPSKRYIILDLNGYVLKGSGSSRVIANGATLKIIDSNPDSTHNFKVGSDGLWALTTDPATTTYESLEDIPAKDTVVEVKGGCITGGKLEGESTQGGGIRNTKKLTIAGGNIIGNTAGKGGAIYTNTSDGLVVEAGNIIGNTATNGGGIYAAKGEVNISGGNIAYNRITKNGSAIYIGASSEATATLEFSGEAKLFRNSTAGTAGCIYISCTGSVNFSGGTIEENIGGVQISGSSSNTATITFSGNTKIQNNTKSGLIQNVNISSGKTININSPETNMKIGVTLQTVTDAFVTGLSEDYSSYLTSDDVGFVVKYDSGNLSLTDAPKIDISSQDDVDAALKSKSNNQVWNITDDFEIDEKISFAPEKFYSVTINGNNHKITGKTGTNNYEHMIAFGVTDKYTETEKIININDLTLKSSNQFKNCIYMQDKVGKGKITLNNVTLDHTTANDETGVPLLNNWCDITITNNLKIITGTNSWHAINMDAKVRTSTLTFSEEEGKKASLTIIDNRTSTQKAKEPQIKLDNYYTVAAEYQADYPQANQTIVNGTTAIGLVPIYASDKSTILGYSIPVIKPQEITYTVVKTFTK